MTSSPSEWLSDNVERDFPFARQGLPKGLLLDAKLIPGSFPPARDIRSVRVTKMSYTSGDDSWSIHLNFPEPGIDDVVSFSREVEPGIPSEMVWRKGFGDFCSLAVAPGPDWDAQTGSVELIPSSPVPLLATRIETGPDRFLGFKLDDEEEWEPSLEPETLISGWNIESLPVGSVVTLSAIPGAGEGRVPCDKPDCPQDVLRISGMSPSPLGELSLETVDCLRSEVIHDSGRFGVKLASDCLPCCDCNDYNNVSRAVARQSAKLGDIRDELEKAVETTSVEYNEAVSKLNDQVPGLVSIHSMQVLPSRISFFVQNNTLTDVYAVVGIFPGSESEAEILPAGDVLEGIHTESPPLKPLGDEDTGLSSPEDSDGWEEPPLSVTVGYGNDFDPIPPKGRTRVSIVFPGIEEVLESMVSCCSALDLVFAPPREPLVHPIFDSDSELQGYVESMGGVGVYLPVPFGNATLSLYWLNKICSTKPINPEPYGVIPDMLGTVSPTHEDTADFYSRDPEALETVFAVKTFTGGGKWKPSFYFLVSDWEGFPGVVSFRAEEMDWGNEPAGLNITLAFPVNNWCSETAGPRQVAEMAAEIKILARRLELVATCPVGDPPESLEEKIEEVIEFKELDLSSFENDYVSILYEQLVELGEEIVNEVREWMWDQMNGSLSWQQTPILKVIATAIYGDASFACRAFSAELETDPYSSDDSDDGMLCLESTISLFQGEEGGGE